MEKYRSSIRKIKDFVIFAGPCTFAFFTVMIMPFIFGIYLSLSDWNGVTNEYTFIGLKNYIAVFSDKQFWNSFIITLKFGFFGVILTNVIAFLLALLLSKKIRGTNFFRSAFFAPNLIGGIILGLIWRFIFNEGLPSIGQNLNIPIIADSFLSSPQKAIWALIIVFVWQMSGYMMVIYIAGFTNIPKELIEAAEIDGATGFSKFRAIIIPMIMPSVTVCLFLTIQRAFMTYDINLALTQGGPFNSTELIAMRVYNKAFISEQYGIGQAQAFFLFIMVVVVTMIQVYLTKRAEVEI